MNTAQIFSLVVMLLIVCVICTVIIVRHIDDKKRKYNPKIANDARQKIDSEKKERNDDITKKYEDVFDNWRDKFDIK